PIEPTVAGPSARKKARTSSSSLGQANRGRPPCRARSEASKKYCKNPEIKTPQAAAWPTLGKKAASAKVIIIDKLRKIDAAAALAIHMRVGRHERRVKCAFGENRSEVIRQPKRHEERVRHWAGAEDRREHDVARETGQPRKEGIATDGEDTTEHPPLLQHGAA